MKQGMLLINVSGLWQCVMFIYCDLWIGRRPNKDAYVPVHLYGQLTQHKEGFSLLQQQVTGLLSTLYIRFSNILNFALLHFLAEFCETCLFWYKMQWILQQQRKVFILHKGILL